MIRTILAVTLCPLNLFHSFYQYTVLVKIYPIHFAVILQVAVKFVCKETATSAALSGHTTGPRIKLKHMKLGILIVEQVGEV